MLVLTASAVCAVLIISAATVALLVCGGLRAWVYCNKQMNSVAYDKEVKKIALWAQRVEAKKKASRK